MILQVLFWSFCKILNNICPGDNIFLVWWQKSEAMVSIDMPAGPSEVLVIADKYANPVHVAADLLSQVSSILNTLLHTGEMCTCYWTSFTLWNAIFENLRHRNYMMSWSFVKYHIILYNSCSFKILGGTWSRQSGCSSCCGRRCWFGCYWGRS